MSYFKTTLAIILSFYTTSSLIGMESFKNWLSPFKYSNPYFEPELQKTLMLIMLKNKEQEKFVLNKDILYLIAKKNYDLYSTELLNSDIEGQSFEELWRDRLNLMVNKPERISISNGQVITINDFDFITINDHGKKLFYKTILNNLVTIEKPSLQTIKQKKLEHYFVMDQDEYNNAIQLPIKLRTKIGDLSAINIGKMKYSHRDYFCATIEGIGGAMIVPVALDTLQKLEWIKSLSFPVTAGITTIGGALGGYYGIWSYDQNKKHQGNTLYPRVLSILNLVSPQNTTSTSAPKWEEPEYTLENKLLVPECLALRSKDQQKSRLSIKKTLIKNKHANIINLKNRE